MAKEAMKLVANNKKVYHDFFVDEKYEAGLVLHGTEAVSYTHLDVYKRQDSDRAPCGSLFLFPDHFCEWQA